MSDQPDHARSFGSVADAYDRGRPGYPTDAVAWLVGEHPVTVLELGAGTGKLTDTLVALGHDVHATDPDEEMLARLRVRLPQVRTTAAGAEELPGPDAAYDVVIGAQCFHWFDHERALPEIARVLKPGGHLALVWNQRDERIPWVKKLGAIIGSQERGTDPTDEIDASGCFESVETETHKHWQVIDRESIQDLVVSRSNVAVLDADGRRAKVAEVLDFYDDYGRGMDGMQLPYVTASFRARVADRIVRTPAPEETQPLATEPSGSASPRPAPPVDDDVLLIDFR